MRFLLFSILVIAWTFAHSSLLLNAAWQDSSGKWLVFLSNQPIRVSYGMDLNGRLDFHQYPRADKTVYQASDFYLHPTIISEVGLSKAKQSEIESAFEEFHSEWEEKLFKGASDSAAKDNGTKIIDELDAFRKELRQRLAANIDAALTADQKKRMRQVQLRFLIHQYGFFQTINQKFIQEMLWGDLGKILELDDDVRASLKTNADKAREHLKSGSERIHNEAMEQLIEFVPEKDRGKLQSCLGDRLKNQFPNLDSFAGALLMPPPDIAGDHE